MKRLVPLVLLAACGGDGPDPCANDACVPLGRTVVKWTFNAYPERGFPMDSCVDFGVHKVAVDVVDEGGILVRLPLAELERNRPRLGGIQVAVGAVGQPQVEEGEVVQYGK